jgi:hypothetical protein
MDALERWQMMFPKELQRWLPQIVPCFNDYLVQVETTEVSESENVVDSPAAASKFASVGTISRAQLMRIRQARIKESQVKKNHLYITGSLFFPIKYVLLWGK